MLNQALTEAGVAFEDRAIYRTEETPMDAESLQSMVAYANAFGPESPAKGEDYLVFASAGGVEAYLKKNSIPAETLPVCIGEYTAERLEACGYHRYLTARPHSAEGIADCILRDACGKE